MSVGAILTVMVQRDMRREAYRRTLQALWPIVVRHVFLLVNAVIVSVSVLLVLFREVEAGVFLGIILIFNMLLGIVQDVRARYALEALQLMTALHIVRLTGDGAREQVLFDEVRQGDRILLSVGDQVPCDGVVESSEGMEVSEAMRTGESDSYPRAVDAEVYAGDIVTTGGGVIRATRSFAESDMGRVAHETHAYAAQPSPIEQAVRTMIMVSSYVLIGVIAYVVIRARFVGAPALEVVNNVGALASVIVPQGLVVITTLLFALGAASYKSNYVLFQKINATEKLGRIRNLCLDKTGTLTDNMLVVEQVLTLSGREGAEERALASWYVAGSLDRSQLMDTLRTYLHESQPTSAVVTKGALAFSSWRRFGGVQVSVNGTMRVVVAGPPDALAQAFDDSEERLWVEQETRRYAGEGKRVFCIAGHVGDTIPTALTHARLKGAVLIVFASGLREGIRDAIAFFTKRGVAIRVISGDHPETVSSVARDAGIPFANRVVTGADIEQMSDHDLRARIDSYRIFARISPRQKVRIIEALKENGFTAMVGDGANDALAVKRADLGISMFAGAPATRRLADIVLMNNSFSALPGAVTLADTYIVHLELLASLFLTGSFAGFFLFIALAAGGQSFPLLPLNLTFSNYFVVGIPSMLVALWAIRATKQLPPVHTENFIRQVVPVAFVGGIVAALSAVVMFAMSASLPYGRTANVPVLLVLIGTGFAFFVAAARYFRGSMTKGERVQVAVLACLELAVLLGASRVPTVMHFFTLPDPWWHVGLISAQGVAVTVCASVILYATIAYMRQHHRSMRSALRTDDRVPS